MKKPLCAPRPKSQSPNASRYDAPPTIGFMTANGTEIDLTVGGARAACPDEESRAEAMRRLDELEKQVRAIKGELAD